MKTTTVRKSSTTSVSSSSPKLLLLMMPSNQVSGWGLTDGFGDQISDVLNYVDVKVIGNQECEELFGSLVSSILCTSGDEYTGSCSGDSGGPLVIDDVQIGVVSFGIIFCLPGYPSGFSRVTSFLDWIETNSDVQIK
ncbi:hypothetical protein GEV33_000049 [Tenebrio molitor]|uniref:Peptidase S1 domain-containing protein n=1 Tax=Tenebrio molitor TaxID=7067 RepID=A0A8J6LLA2_TENMO|nr:hypothetical protein GEV33_000049 [Tenebrio molitor]